VGLSGLNLQSTRNNVGRFPFQRHRCRRDRAINESPSASDFVNNSSIWIVRLPSVSLQRNACASPWFSMYSTRKTRLGHDVFSFSCLARFRLACTISSFQASLNKLPVYTVRPQSWMPTKQSSLVGLLGWVPLGFGRSWLQVLPHRIRVHTHLERINRLDEKARTKQKR
jgi:hypothetical protein